jgi:ribA/ribD-fused uncharacterized protein
MVEKIGCFRDKYRFLSNFWKCPFIIDDKIYITNEHYYQSMKARSERSRKRIRDADTPYLAKKRGRSVNIREDWEEVKVDIMRKGLKAKFTQNESLKQKLLKTGDAYLEEGNDWGDTFWGVDLDTGKGQNHLGKMLMKLRDDLRNEKIDR